MVVILVLARDIPSLSLRSLICPWVFRNLFNAAVYCRGTLGQPDLLRDLSSVLFNEGDGFKAGKGADKEMGICGVLALVGVRYRNGGGVLASSSVLRFMGARMLAMKISLGCMFMVLGVFLRFLNTNWFADLSSSLCQNCWVLRVFVCS